MYHVRLRPIPAHSKLDPKKFNTEPDGDNNNNNKYDQLNSDEALAASWLAALPVMMEIGKLSLKRAGSSTSNQAMTCRSTWVTA